MSAEIRGLGFAIRNGCANRKTTMDQPPPRSILVVDDDVMILRVMRETLASFTKCEVDTSPNSEYAFELALKKSYDLFVFDLVLPSVDGMVLYTLIDKVYQHVGSRRLPPLLLMSGNDQGKDRISAALREPGVRGFLGKPFTIDRLLVKARECLPADCFKSNPSLPMVA